MTKKEVAMEDINKWNAVLMTQITKDVPEISDIEEDAIWGKVSKVLEDHFGCPYYRSQN